MPAADHTGAPWHLRDVSPNLDYATNEFATVSVYVSNGSTSAYDSLNLNVVYGTSCGLPMC